VNAGNALKRNLSKTENLAQEIGYNYTVFMIFLEGAEGSVCGKNQAGTEEFSPAGFLFPRTKNFLCLRFHAVRSAALRRRAAEQFQSELALDNYSSSPSFRVIR
jgi:hypothetical protein